mmetsp:Transcript_2729/g.8001  ORF Transcript_2729/g.8001 Transcript_2729/m.8001 type:complete len:461 (+) Transcript_2729:213-1595(+)|eukprot:CAMPEP_0119269438 /NCGR_PEP_ID=MMETSP1329-20130426/6844_1 /TAXON_ID=114041 /ORGANISM="Genus nov. species nov., Strain RCC1024" /LENGTH=460 /DNA_ID=CAMNT_0007269437 /DNA_START=179 /DNA_END=1561 /DNA_ORIENTATION=-
MRNPHLLLLLTANSAFIILPQRNLALRRHAAALEEYEATELAAPFPPALEGTLFALGPGSDRRRGAPCAVRDGHGAAAAVTFRDGAAVARARFVRTEAYVRELREYKPGSDIAERNTANGAALYWAGKLFALADGAKPYMLDPLSLGTSKKSELGGLLKDPGDSFDAWARPDGASLAQAVLEPGFLFQGPALAFWRFDDAFRTGRNGPEVAKLPLEKDDEVLAWAPEGEAFVAILKTPRGLALARVLGGAAARRPLDLGGAASRVEIVKAAAGALDLIVQRSAVHEGPGATRAHGEWWRVAPGATERCGTRAGLGAPRALGAGWACSDVDDGALVVLDGEGSETAVWEDPDGLAVGAPAAAGPYLLALLHGAARTDVAAFDAADVAAGPVARAALPRPLPATAFAGPFVPGLAPTLAEIKSAETLARLYARKSAEWNEIEAGFSGLGIKQFLFPKGVSGG